ncbi:MAG: hypothetical protein HPY44_03080 [Armatimonadetes bacterium]|nr:hypothetical protein [Armatimonadota bacterium]
MTEILPIPPVPADPPEVVPGEWSALLEELPDTGRIMVLGPGDTGKSTLAWWLARELHRRAPRAGQAGGVAVVDSDVGQSRIGPPATVGMHVLGDRGCAFYFVGAVSPNRRPASVVRATLTACRDATVRKVAWTVVDTTGYVTGEVGVAIKTSKIRHLRPLHIVTLGPTDILAPILDGFREDPQVTVHPLPVPAAVRCKTVAARCQWRQEAFATWLVGTELHWIRAAERDFVNAPAPELFAGSPECAEELRGLLVGFSDADGRGIALGLLHTFDFRQNQALIRCSEAGAKAPRVEFGCIRLEPDGSQIGARAGRRADGQGNLSDKHR